MRHLASVTSFASLMLLAGSACVDPLEEAALGTAEQAFENCPKWECGSNSPVIELFGFHELNKLGLPNDQGFTVLGLWKHNLPYTLDVTHGRIIGHNSTGTLAGASLKDAQLRLRQGGATGKTYAIRITEVTMGQTFAAIGGVKRPIETYQLDVAEMFNGNPPTGGWRNLCRNPPARDSADLLGMNRYHAVVFEGERIDAAQKTIQPVLSPSWFNLGCAGHALAKLAMNGQTQAAKDSWGFQTSILERQAFLKMVTGDYCGTGRPFTVAGQPLQWKDPRGYLSYVSPSAGLGLEARWSPSGATCLTAPRVNANHTALGDLTFEGDVLDDLWAECGALPACGGTVDDVGSAMFVSANPLP